MKKGMTLIKLLVAFLIIVTSVTALMWSFVECKKIIRNNTHKMNAITIINQAFEGAQRRDTETTLDAYLLGFQPFLKSERVMDDGIPQTYFIELISTTDVFPTTTTELRRIVGRVTWDQKFLGAKSNNSLVVELYTSEPH